MFRKTVKGKVFCFLLALGSSGLTGCGGGGGGGASSTPSPTAPTATFSVMGVVTGLTSSGLQLRNGPDQLAVAANATSFVFPTKIAVGASYSVTVVTQPSGQTCMVTSGSGVAVAANSNGPVITVSCSATVHTLKGSVTNLLVGGLTLNNGSQQIQVESGATSFDFFTPQPEGTPYSVMIGTQPAGQRCTVLNGTGVIGTSDQSNVSVVCRLLSIRVTDSSGLVHSYALGLDGSLSSIGNVSAGSGASAIVGTPDGAFTYVANGNDNNVSSYRVGTDGTLSSLGSTSPAGTRPLDLAMAPSGKFLYVAATGDQKIAVFAIGSDGILTPVGTTSTGGEVTKLAITPNGSYLYYLGFDLNSVQGYSIAPNGLLTPLAQGIFSPSSYSASSLVASTDSTSLYLAGDNDSKVIQLSIGSDGTLTALSPLTAPEQPGQVRAIVTSSPSVVLVGTPVITALSRDPTTGLLTDVVPCTTQFNSPVFSDLQITPEPSSALDFLIVLDSTSGSIASMSVGDGECTSGPHSAPLIVAPTAANLLIQ